MRAPAFVRRVLERIGAALDPAENLLADGLAAPWSDPSHDVVEDLRRYAQPPSPRLCVFCPKPAVDQIVYGWEPTPGRMGLQPPKPLIASACADHRGHSCFPRSDRTVDEL